MTTTIKDYEKKITKIMERIEANKNNPSFYESTPIFGMHDNGNSEYENEMAMARYYKRQIEKIEEKAKADAERERKIAIKAEKLGMTVEEYKAKKEEEEKAKAFKAKVKRYHAELEELNKRKAYLEKWLAENEVE